jgi:hypothetical protein
MMTKAECQQGLSTLQPAGGKATQHSEDCAWQAKSRAPDSDAALATCLAHATHTHMLTLVAFLIARVTVGICLSPTEACVSTLRSLYRTSIEAGAMPTLQKPRLHATGQLTFAQVVTQRVG